MLATFLRPIAHRGLHDAARGVVENTAAAFKAAIGRGYGIECDLRPARGGLPVVFHDETVERITLQAGPIADMGPAEIAALRTRDGGHGVLTLHDFLALADGQVPLLVEIKSEWEAPDIAFLSEIARQALDYRGDIALMSFDPDVMTVMRELATEIPRGLVSGSYRDENGETWWGGRIGEERARRLADLLESGPVAPSFFAYHVGALPTPVTRYVREVQGLPVYAWTVRTPEELAQAEAFADAPIFEGIEV